MSVIRTVLYVAIALLIWACEAGVSGGHRSARSTTEAKDQLSEMRTDTVRRDDKVRQGKGGLLLTRYRTYADFTSSVDIRYFDGNPGSLFPNKRPRVRVTHTAEGGTVVSEMYTGVSELDFLMAHDEGFAKQVGLVFMSPYGVWNLMDLRRIYALARRRDGVFGEGDVAFYDLAERIMYNIDQHDLAGMPSGDISEKGYLNTFNHILSQAFMTSIFSERLADFVADIHERRHMPDLITGAFTREQISDIEFGPTDNYVDLINNEWGQELGKMLQAKYSIERETYWTPELLADYMNDIQGYCSWSFRIGFRPFRPGDDIIIRFASKINRVVDDVPLIR